MYLWSDHANSTIHSEVLRATDAHQRSSMLLASSYYVSRHSWIGNESFSRDFEETYFHADSPDDMIHKLYSAAVTNIDEVNHAVNLFVS